LQLLQRLVLVLLEPVQGLLHCILSVPSKMPRSNGSMEY
jgi:hypothetical protein